MNGRGSQSGGNSRSGNGGGGGGHRGGSAPNRSPNDDRSDVMNPNNAAHDADQANRARQADEDDD